MSYIRVLLYVALFEPVIDFWIKTVDDTPLVIDQATVDSICKDNETAEVIEITPANIEKLASYQHNKNYRLDVYPSNLEIYTSSADIKPVEENSDLGYSNAEIQLKGYKPKFQKTKALVINIDGEEHEIARYTFQEFEKIEENEKENFVMTDSGKAVVAEDEKRFQEKMEQQLEDEIKEFEELAKIEEDLHELSKIISSNLELQIYYKMTDIDICQLVDKMTGQKLFEGYPADAIVFLRERGAKNG